MKTNPAAMTEREIWEWFQTAREIDVRPLNSRGLVAARRATRPAGAGPRTKEQARRIGRSKARYGLPCCSATGRTLARTTRTNQGREAHSRMGSPSIQSTEISDTTARRRTTAPMRTARTSTGLALDDVRSGAAVAMSPPARAVGATAQYNYARFVGDSARRRQVIHRERVTRAHARAGSEANQPHERLVRHGRAEPIAASREPRDLG